MKDKNIVVITDCTDIAYNEVFAVLDSLLSKERVTNVKIHPMVPVKKFSVINAAFSIRLLADLYGEDTYFLVIVSATKDTPDRIFGKTKHGITFIGNNSGYFSWMLQDFGCEYACKNKLSKDVNYKSFGGKFVQAPTTINLLLNKAISTLGEDMPIEELHAINIHPGTVVHCDNFGLIKIMSQQEHSLSEGDVLQVFINSKPKIKAMFSKSMKKHEDNEWILYPGSSINGLLELGKVRHSNSAQELGVTEGDIITWQKI